jgi:hypothetical protein
MRVGVGMVHGEKVLRLLACCQDEEDATVWEAISSVLMAMDKLLLEGFGVSGAALPTQPILFPRAQGGVFLLCMFGGL